MKHSKPILVAIVGGSGSGKSWLAERLRIELGDDAGRLSQDDFYLDRSHLTPAQRARINYDHPRATDWAALERVLRALRNGKPVQSPQYDFKTHCRRDKTRLLKPKAFFLVEGLWLLRRPTIRRLFHLRLFRECPAKTRLGRRLKRDTRARARTAASVRDQFTKTVEPMHCRFVTTQTRWADLVLTRSLTKATIRRLAGRIRLL